MVICDPIFPAVQWPVLSHSVQVINKFYAWNPDGMQECLV